MNTNINTNHSNAYKPGQRFKATVKAVRESGVNIEMAGGRGAGVISPRCWGKGAERAKALAKIKPGDTYDVVVRSFDPRTCTLSLVLAGCEKPMPPVRKAVNPARKAFEPPRPVVGEPRRVCHSKPEHKLLQKETVVLVDASNLLGHAGPGHAAAILGGISGALAAQECKCLHFMEYRCYSWARYNQATEADVDALDGFVKRSDVVLIRGGRDEADEHILQYAEALPDSVIWTKDQYTDHANAHPSIVGSDRIVEFECKEFAGKLFITADGLARAIVVETQAEAAKLPQAAPQAVVHAVVEAPAPEVRGSVAATCPQEAEEREPEQAKPAVVREKGYATTAEHLLGRGEVDRAVRFLGKVAKSDPGAYCALADVYREGRFAPADAKKAVRYERLASKAEKCARERDLRDRRRRAESARSGAVAGHFSAKRRAALGMALCDEGLKAVHEYFKTHSRCGRRAFGRAA